MKNTRLSLSLGGRKSACRSTLLVALAAVLLTCFGTQNAWAEEEAVPGYMRVDTDAFGTQIWFGATHTINARQKDAAEFVQKLTDGYGADWVFVTVGNAAAVTQGMQMSGLRGTTVAVGLPPKTEAISVTAFDLAILKERTLRAIFMGSPRASIDIPRLVTLYKAGRLKLDELVSGRYPIEQINEAVANVESGEALRNVIMFG